MAETPYSASIRVRPRKDGTAAHDVRYRLNGNQQTKTFDDGQKARQWQRIVQQIGPAEALKLLHLEVKNLPTVSEYAETYIQSRSGTEGRTLDQYRLYMRVSIAPTLGPLPLDAVTTERVSGWVNEQAKKYAAKTVKNRYSFLAEMFRHAVKNGLLTKTPCVDIGLPSSERREMVFLSPAEFETLYAFIPSHFKPFVRFLAASGMRFGEATALKPSDFDLDAQTVRVARAWKRSLEKGFYVGPPKTARGRRTISLPASIIEQLRPLVESGREWVFVNHDGNPIRQSKFYANTWIPARRLANGQQPYERDGAEKAATQATEWRTEPAGKPIGKWPRVHDIRHTHASWLILDGMPMIVVQRRMGHESIKTTVDTYGHISPDMLWAASASIDRMLTA